MKQIVVCLSCVAVSLLGFFGGVTSAELSAGQQLAVQVAANKIVVILDKQHIGIDTFVQILRGFEDKFVGDDARLEVVDALKYATLDAYYEVHNFAMCEVYSDGCNTCTIVDDYAVECTEMACVWEGVPSCEQYEGEEPADGQDPISDQELGCTDAGGSFSPLYNECENIDQTTCEDLGGTFNECGSACRHEPDGSICTMQCVPYCAFGDTSVSNENETSEGVIKTYTVAPDTVTCEGVAPQTCMRVKEEPFGDYELFYDQIEGFDYHEGTQYEIQVEVTKVDNPPADASGYTYTLITILSTSTTTADYTDAQMALDAAMSRWETQDMGEYTLTQQLTCFCMVDYTRPITYTVTDGVADRDGAVYADEGEEAIDSDNAPELLTVEEAFTMIQDAIDQYAYSIEFEYDETYGHPTMISIDYNEMMADEEVYYTFELNE